MFNSVLNRILHSFSYREPKSYKPQIPGSLDPSDASVMGTDASHSHRQLRPAPEQISAETQDRFTLHFLLSAEVGVQSGSQTSAGAQRDC